jgi:hypothetical protein
VGPTAAGFSGRVKYIIFNEDIPTGGAVGAYFVAFTGKVTISLKSPDYNVISRPDFAAGGSSRADR